MASDRSEPAVSEPAISHPAASNPAVSAKGLTRRYGDRPALQDVSFELATGQTLTVFGANGAGKSTLLRILATLLRPHAGDVQALGCQLPDDGWRLRGQVAMVAHEPLLYRDLTAHENLAFCARLFGIAPGRVEQLLAAVGLDGRSHELVRNFSKGMLQRLSVARALLGDPPLLLLDEPLANLDPGAGDLLEPLIGRSAGRTRVLVTHDVERGLDEADVALGLTRGNVTFCTPANQLTPADVKELYK
jgi:heme exporter protein A